jgi:hypothetical protein
MPKIDDRGTLQSRFLRRLIIGDEDDCWLWTGATNDKGYGQVYNVDRLVYTHRLAYQFAHGVELKSNQIVRHTCDTPSCCNPKHLILGTKKDNSDDMYRRGRNVNVVGERNGKSKLTAVQAVQIKEMLKMGISIRKIADAYGVTHGAIQAISSGKTWINAASV